MAVAGIDIGSQSTKVVILEGDRILAAVILKTGESGESEARRAMEEALRQARLKLEDMKSVVSTGIGRMSVPFARKQRSIVGCLARGAYFLYPQARTVLDGGADSFTAIRLSADGGDGVAGCGNRWILHRHDVGERSGGSVCAASYARQPGTLRVRVAETDRGDSQPGTQRRPGEGLSSSRSVERPGCSGTLDDSVAPVWGIVTTVWSDQLDCRLTVRWSRPRFVEEGGNATRLSASVRPQDHDCRS